MPSSPGGKKEDIGPPGAGTLYVYGRSETGDRRLQRVFTGGEIDFSDLPNEEPLLVPSPDALLDCGIADYSFLPISSGGILGKGKFSTVYKVNSADGNTYALKHTPLHPHHPLISSRLLREPTLLAQLPPHPCLIGVEGWVRTEGHFYLIEQFATSHVPLPAHPLPLSPSRAAYILDQLVSVVRDGLHNGGRVCHRDLKGENILIDINTGEILLLDLGLATHYSASQPRLTTCCGSPAFHSPEIVNALNHPPGAITYYGPELDIWCVALTMLALLLQTRFPLGPTHTSRYVMQERVRDRLQELDEFYPPNAPWRGRGNSKVSDTDKKFDEQEWKRVRRAMEDFLDIDGVKRMASFAVYDVGEIVNQRVAAHSIAHKGRSFKTTSFIPAEVKYTLPIYLDDPTTPQSPSPSGPIILHNPSGESEKRILSYIKYLLRSSGILYHCLPNTSPTILQLVLPLPPSTSPSSSLEPIPSPIASRNRDQRPKSHDREREKVDGNPSQPSLLSTIFSLGKKSTTSPSTSSRSASVPPKAASKAIPSTTAQKKGKEWATKCWIKIEFEHKRVNQGPGDAELGRRRSKKTQRSSRQSSRNRVTNDYPVPHYGDGDGLERLSSIADSNPVATEDNLRRFGTTRSIIEGQVDNGIGNPDHGEIAQALEGLKVVGTTSPFPLSRVDSHARRTVSRASSRLRHSEIPDYSGVSTGHGVENQVSQLSRQVSIDPSENGPIMRKRPESQSRKSSYQTVYSRRQYSLPLIDTITITSTEARAYALLRQAFNVKHVQVELPSVEPTPELDGSKEGVLITGEVDRHRDQSKDVDIGEERGRGRSKEISKSPIHSDGDRITSNHKIDIGNGIGNGNNQAQGHLEVIVQTPKLDVEGQGHDIVKVISASGDMVKKREVSRGRKSGLWEGWFRRGSYYNYSESGGENDDDGHSSVGKGMTTGNRSSSLPPAVVLSSDGLWSQGM